MTIPSDQLGLATILRPDSVPDSPLYITMIVCLNESIDWANFAGFVVMFRVMVWL